MKNNPFVSETFNSIWSKHFNASRQSVHFNFLKEGGFVKPSFLPFYYNIGKNITNGMSYSIDPLEKDYCNKVFLIHDVPSYFSIHTANTSGLKVDKIPQYKGFLTKLEQFQNYDDFAKNKFKSNTRYKYRRNQERLEACFDISYAIYHGHIEKDVYENIMEGFKALLTKRFNELQKDNDILETWDYYFDLIYDMLIEKRALLITICNENRPIGVSLSFLSNTTMFYAITSFDTDYYRYNLGHTTIIKLFQWCYDNGYTVYDFSKGEYDYKNRWTNKDYTYENHILYDSKSITATIIAKFIKLKYAFKQYLRDKNVNEQYVKLKFILKGKKSAVSQKRKFSILKIDPIEDVSKMQLINMYTNEFSFLKSIVYDELYKNPEAISNIIIYNIDSSDKESYYVVGEENSYIILMN